MMAQCLRHETLSNWWDEVRGMPLIKGALYPRHEWRGFTAPVVNHLVSVWDIF